VTGYFSFSGGQLQPEVNPQVFQKNTKKSKKLEKIKSCKNYVILVKIEFFKVISACASKAIVRLLN
jgi:Leu/Phe-tRNA-protein transferase